MNFLATRAGVSFLALLIACVATVPAVAMEMLLPIPIVGTPPARVAHWIRIIWGGAINHPIVPVYFIPERRTAPIGSITRYVVLQPREYEALSTFTNSFQCSPERISGKPPYPNTIEIDDYSHKNIRDLCVFARDEGCRYLFGLASLPDIDWSHKDTWPLFQFEAELGCAAPLTPAHDRNLRYQQP